MKNLTVFEKNKFSTIGKPVSGKLLCLKDGQPQVQLRLLHRNAEDDNLFSGTSVIRRFGCKWLKEKEDDGGYVWRKLDIPDLIIRTNLRGDFKYMFWRGIDELGLKEGAYRV